MSITRHAEKAGRTRQEFFKNLAGSDRSFVVAYKIEGLTSEFSETAAFAFSQQREEAIRIDRVQERNLLTATFIPNIMPKCSEGITIEKDAPMIDKKYCKHEHNIITEYLDSIKESDEIYAQDVQHDKSVADINYSNRLGAIEGNYSARAFDSQETYIKDLAGDDGHIIIEYKIEGP